MGQILVIERISVLIVASFGGLLCLLLRHFRNRHDSHDSTLRREVGDSDKHELEMRLSRRER